MAMLRFYSVHDTKVGFGTPFVAVNDGVVIRDFTNVINDSTKELSSIFSDVSVYFVGEFETITCVFTSSPLIIVKGTDVKKVSNG